MIRNAPLRRILSVVVIACVGLMSMPIDECDDYAFFLPGSVSAHAEGPSVDPAGSDQRHACSCIVCDPTTDDVFLPRLPAPQRGQAVTDIPVVHRFSAHLPSIFRPPIA